MLDGSTLNAPDISILRQHFERALNVFEIAKTQRQQHAQEFLNDQKFAAVVTHIDGGLITSNASFDRQLKLRAGQSVYDNLERLGSPKKERNVREAQGGGNAAVVSRYFLPNGQETIVVIEQLRDHMFDDIDAKNVLLIKCCYAEWTQSGASILSDAFVLTTAELEIAELL